MTGVLKRATRVAAQGFNCGDRRLVAEVIGEAAPCRRCESILL